MSSEQVGRDTAEANPDVYLPEWMEATSTKAEHATDMEVAEDQS